MKTIWRRSLDGFTLFEVLVALAILAIALASVTKAVLSATDTGAEVKLRQQAQWVMENRVAWLRATDAFPQPGIEEGEAAMAGQRFTWRQTTIPTPNPRIRRSELTVRLADAPQTLAHSLVFLSPR